MLVERGRPATETVPQSVHSLIAARIDPLAPAAKAVLQDSAVIGKVFWAGAVAAVGDRARDEVDACLRELIQKEFVRRIRRSSVEGEAEYSLRSSGAHGPTPQVRPKQPRTAHELRSGAVRDRAVRDLSPQTALLAVVCRDWGRSRAVVGPDSDCGRPRRRLVCPRVGLLTGFPRPHSWFSRSSSGLGAPTLQQWPLLPESLQ
jgi:hypothetical protein